MPDSRDYRNRRPPRRKSWDKDEDTGVQGEQEGGNNGQVLRPDRNINQTGSERAGQSNTRLDRSASRSGQKYASGAKNGAKYGAKYDPASARSDSSGIEEEEEKRARSKRNQKRLWQMLGNQALCLAIIFGLINTFNWMASDYSGDYMGQSSELRNVRLKILRRATSSEAELLYGQSGLLELDQSKDQSMPQGDKIISLDFVTPEKWRSPNKFLKTANFTGRIDGNTVEGMIKDDDGQYKVKLEKNVLTSLFAQLQAHIPKFPAFRLPSLFDEQKAKSVKHL